MRPEIFPNRGFVRLLCVAAVGASFLMLPGTASAAATLQNPGLEADANGDSTPDCWQEGGYGANVSQFTRTAAAHSGSWAEQVRISSRTSGDRKLITRMDSGACAPAASVGAAYTLSGWYRSDVPTQFVIYRRDSSGSWSYWRSGPSVSASSTWTKATWTTPAVPTGTTHLSFGFNLTRVGTVTSDDYGMALASGGPVQALAPEASCGVKQTAWVAPQQQTGPNQYLYTPRANSSICVTRTAEQASRGNSVANAYVPSDAQLAAFRATTNHSGDTPRETMHYAGVDVTGRHSLGSLASTDDLIEFYAKKWGIPEDHLRAQYASESDWRQRALGDLRTQTSADRTWYSNLFAGYCPNSTQCYESVGIAQVKARPTGSSGSGTDPLRRLSTAFNIDYHASVARFNYDNPYGKRSAWGDGSYAPLRGWDSLCAWFSAYPYSNANADSYCATVQRNLANRIWLAYL